MADAAPVHPLSSSSLTDVRSGPVGRGCASHRVLNRGIGRRRIYLKNPACGVCKRHRVITIPVPLSCGEIASIVSPVRALYEPPKPAP
jgi:hypothetical protein